MVSPPVDARRHIQTTEVRRAQGQHRLTDIEQEESSQSRRLKFIADIGMPYSGSEVVVPLVVVNGVLCPIDQMELRMSFGMTGRRVDV